MGRQPEWTDEQNIVAVALAIAESAQEGIFSLADVRRIVGPNAAKGTELPAQRWISLVREMKESLPHMREAVQAHCRTRMGKGKVLKMESVSPTSGAKR